MPLPRSAPAPKAPDGAALGWELLAAARPYLDPGDINRVHIALGIGEAFDAIDTLVTAIAQNGIPLSDDLVVRTVMWLDCYLGQDAEPRLRALLAVVKTSPPQHLSARHGLARSRSDGAQYRHLRSG